MRYWGSTTRRALGAGLAVSLLASACGSGGSASTAGSSKSASSGGSSSTSTGSSSPSGSTIHIGTVLSLTGAIAAECLPDENALKGVIAAVNASGGVNGHKIVDTILDDGSSSTQALVDEQRLASQGVLALVGGCDSAEASTLIQTAKKDSVPVLFPFTAVPGLVQPVQPYVFDADPLYESQITAVVTGAFKKFGSGSVFAAVVQAPDYQAQLSAVKSATTGNGGKYAGGVAIVPNAPDIAPEVAQILKARPKYLFLNTEATDSLRIVQDLEQQGFIPSKIIGVQNLLLDPFVDGIDATVAKHVVAVSPVNGGASSAGKACDATVKKYEPSATLGYETLEACSFAQEALTAIGLAGANPTRASLVAALNQVSNKSLSPLVPPMTFTPSDHMGVTSVYLEQVSGKSEVNIGTVSAALPG